MRSKAAVLAYALLICASTQFTKQHYIVDVAGGLLTALLAFALGMRTNWYRPVQRMFERVNQRVWRDMGETHERYKKKIIFNAVFSDSVL